MAKTTGGVTTKYLVDTNNHTGYAQVVEEITNGSVSKQFTFGHDLISQRIGANVNFYQYDGHGSVRQLTNTSGVITDTYTYDAFGNLISRTGTTDNSYLYAGEQFDANLGFYYLRARYMNPSSGRFHSMDSYEGNPFEPKTLHKYLYAENDGVNNTDPTGNFTVSQVAIVVGIISVIAAISVGTYYYVKNLRFPIRASWKWQNTWDSPDGKELLNDGEIQIVKQTAYAAFKKAYVGFDVDSVEGSGGREILVSNQLGNGVGATFPGSRSSTVYYANMRYTLDEVLKNSSNRSRLELIEALGRGLGATAAHEVGHQSGLEFSTHPSAQGFYDTKALNGTSVDHFFGELKWSPEALDKMNNVLARVQ